MDYNQNFGPQGQYNPQMQMAVPNPRPTFVTILCILSFISCGYMILSSGATLISGATFNPSFNSIPGQALNPFPGLANFQRINWIVSGVLVLTNLLSLYGIILMFQLKKPGFFVYLIAEILPWYFYYIQAQAMIEMLTPNSLVPDAPGVGFITSLFSGASYFILGFRILFDIVFIVLYAVNLKRFTKTGFSFA